MKSPLGYWWGTVGLLAAAGVLTLATSTDASVHADPDPSPTTSATAAPVESTTPETSSTATESPIAEQQLVITPALALSPQQGSPGTSVTATVTGFSGCDDISLQFGAAPIQPPNGWSSDPATGGWSAQFAVPASATNGRHDVTAQCGGAIAPSTFTVVSKPTLTVSPDHGRPGTAFTAVASGFGLCRLMWIRWDHDDPFFAATTSETSVRADSTVPSDATVGEHTVTALCGEKPAPATFTVVPPDRPSLTLDPVQGGAGRQVTAVLSGFGQCDAPILRWDGTSLPTDPIDGERLVVHFTVPTTTTAGDHQVIAECEHTHSPAATFTVIVTPKPTLTLGTGHGLPGTQLTVAGTGFDCGADRVNVRWDDGTRLADASSGAFSDVPFTVPSRAATGVHTVTAACAHHPDVNATQPFTVTSEPATAGPPPQLGVQPGSGHPGDRVRASGDRLPCARRPGPVTLSWGDGTPAVASVDASGRFDVELVVPAGAEAGQLTLHGACSDGVVLAADFTVLPTAPPPPPPPPPPPAPPLIPWMLTALLVGVLGLLGWKFARRGPRRQTTPVVHSVHAVARPAGAAAVAVRETPAPGESTHAFRIEMHVDVRTTTLGEVDDDCVIT